MSDFSIRGSVPSFFTNQPQTILDQLENALRTPAGNETARYEQLKEMFQNLTPDDAKVLFDSLQANKDPVAKEFNSTFQAGDLVSILRSRFSPEVNASSQDPIEQILTSDISAKSSSQKMQLGIDGSAIQRTLHDKIPAMKARSIDLPRDAANKDLNKINVNRQTSDDLTITHYPNGVQVKRRPETGVTHSEDVFNTKGNTGTVQNKWSEEVIEVVPPPGGSVSMNKEGKIVVSNWRGDEVARMDRDGNVEVHTNQGDYKQSSDGQIHFSTKEKDDPGSLKKAGTISPGDYEKYGISTDGSTIRFPNGVEYSRYDGVRVPKDIGTIIAHKIGSERSEEILTGRSIDGKPLVDGSHGNVQVRTDAGVFTIDQNGNVSFWPNS